MASLKVKRWKHCLIIIAIALSVNEWLSYVLMPHTYWPDLSTVQLDSIRLLIVGDPQLLGNHFTASGIFGFLAQWDSDRFVEKTFNLAYHYVKPDLIIFLGDNLDEGEIAEDDEFSRYVERFKNVFHPVDFNKAIVLAGDNDIGGEVEPPYIETEKRFDKYFKNDNFIVYQFLEFVKINYMTQSNNYLDVPNMAAGTKRIILSHIPLIPSHSKYKKKVLDHLKPHLILSAHEHISMHYVVSRESGEKIHTETSYAKYNSELINITELITHEIMVPTCSYRMGTDKMGYGVLMAGSHNQFTYTVLWLPSRIHQLLWYLGIIVFIVILLIPTSVWSTIDRCLVRREAILPLGKMKKTMF